MALDIIIHTGNQIVWPFVGFGFRSTTKQVFSTEADVDLLGWFPASAGFRIVLTGIIISCDVDTTVVLKGSVQGSFLPIPIKAGVPFELDIMTPIWVGNKGESILFDVSDAGDLEFTFVGYECS